MPPKSKNARDKSAVAAVETPVATPAKKRGRPAKSQTGAVESTPITAEPPKKRGRPSKVTAEDVTVLPDASEPTKRGRGRKPNASKSAALAATPNKAKEKGTEDEVETVADMAEPTPRKRGRPPKVDGLNLKRVAGTARVGKCQAAQSKSTTITTTTKLRTRLPPASKVSKGEPAPQPARRGRPPKNAAQASAATALAKKKAPRGRKPAEVPVAKPTKPTKPLAPRKMRGHTVRQIPDKYIVQVDQLLHDLMQADADATSEKQVQEEEANQAHDMEVEADVEDNVEDNVDEENVDTEDQGPEDAALDAGADSESGHQQNSLGDQYSDGVTDDLGQDEPISDQSREQEQDLQSEVNGDLDDPPNHEDEDGILIPQQEIDIPDEGYANGAEDGQLL
ncbi:hypothetical protein COCMIDRAFT_91405 [Bipolaris oryzae ATCC 44560]|uniref:Uncharacterized protein n=1 Tax=Bipolaris oryzae ATCC 44560 TaxID=930090 RepID=W6ZHX6_COCMI|nr:uncharacterized protein COCMIDRAFT_91405 [Bipolaris oryzae ATCC 44560]EUC47019.1 hypothetical protein COCMIDRAFT_91405 [Bipolaris oryzae ATCC 44560]